MTSLNNMVCPMCPELQTSLLHLKLPEYLKHLKLFHLHQPHFSVTCGIGGCMRTFTNLRTFQNHISGFHSYVDCLEGTGDGNAESAQYSDDSCNDVSDCMDVDECDDTTIMPPLKMSAALFILNLKEKQKLTQVALQKVIEGVTSLFQSHLLTLRDQVCEKIAASGISRNIILDLFEQEEHTRPFLGLETKHQQLCFFRNHLNFIVS